MENHEETEEDSEDVVEMGWLLKQRDVFRGQWRPRYFILEGALLRYFLDPADDNPVRLASDARAAALASFALELIDATNADPATPPAARREDR